MPLTHVQNIERQRARKRGEDVPEPEAPQPSEEEEASGFETAFAPVPGETPPEAPVAPEPPSFPASAQLPAAQPRPAPTHQPRGPTPNVRVLHQTGPYPAGSVVPTSCFADIQRLLNLQAVEYTYEEAVTGPDQSMLTAMTVGQPATPASSAIPRAPWVQATAREILGPATPRPVMPPAQTGYTTVRTEWGNTMPVADRP